jgi:poly(3-hydroxybutyrate) depolymerase
MTRSTIRVNGVTRYYTIVNPNLINNALTNILLCFPGGGQTDLQFIQNTRFSTITNLCIISFLGQDSINGNTFQNAFPWLHKNSYQNDVQFVDSVLAANFGINIPHNIFLTGMSDGAGFAILYAWLSGYKNNIRGIGICSEAHFGLNSKTNYGVYDIRNSFVGTNNTIIPYNIILPPSNISLFVMHGSADKTMPYNGQQYMNSNALNALDKTLWKTIDPSVSASPLNGNTHTAVIFQSHTGYYNSVVTNNNLTKIRTTNPKNSNYYRYVYHNTTNNVVMNLITVNGQDHSWSGHSGLGRNSTNSANLYLDATHLILRFFNLTTDYKAVKNTTVPKHLLKYNNRPF